MTASKTRKFRFGVTGRGATLAEWRAFAIRAEALGYSSLVLPDHFSRQLAPLPALAVAAQATTSLRLGTHVLDNDFRHPTVLAKEVATLDVLSEGRFELGIGTGSQPVDNQRTGIPLDSPGVRVERLAETLQILNACFTQDVVHFAGKHYQVDDLPGYPQPVQQPRMPIFIGARGPRMLRLAAREADIIGVMGGPGESHADKLAMVREAAGDRFLDIEFTTLYLQVQVDGQPADSTPYSTLPGLVGTQKEIVEKLLAQREERLISYIVIIGSALEAFAPIVARLAGT